MTLLDTIAGETQPRVRYWRLWRTRRRQRLMTVLIHESQAIAPPGVAEGEDLPYIRAMIGISGTGMALSVGFGIFNPALGIAAAPFIIFTSINIIRSAWFAATVERRLRISMIDSLAIIGLLATQYYFAAALTNTLYWVGRYLLVMTEDRAQQNLINVFGNPPRSVWRLVDGVEVETAFNEIAAGDVLVIRAGETVASDGSVIDGAGTVDQRALTGESQPAEKTAGDTVLAATVVISGTLVVEVARAGDDTVAAQIGTILAQTADYRRHLEARSVQLADSSVAPTLAAGGITLLVAGPLAGVTALMANYSEVLRVVAPLGMLNFLSLAAEQGILVKDGRALEQLGFVDVVVFDKTGTLTLDQLTVGRVVPVAGTEAHAVLWAAATAEQRQSHPIAQAILQAAQAANLRLPAVDDAHYEVSFGLRVRAAGTEVHVGSGRFMAMHAIPIDESLLAAQAQSDAQGHSVVYVARDGVAIGLIELQARIRPEAAEMVAQLQARGLDLYIISGDRERTTHAFAERLGIANVFAEVLPQDKAAIVQGLQAQGRRVCFVGDGINDAIALKGADVSISISGATHIATDTAQIVLMDGTLRQLIATFALARAYRANLRTSAALTLTTGLFTLGGIFVLNFRVFSSVVLYNLNLIASVANAMQPALRRGKGSVRGMLSPATRPALLDDAASDSPPPQA